LYRVSARLTAVSFRYFVNGAKVVLCTEYLHSG
jgi:hypothetical protein